MAAAPVDQSEGIGAQASEGISALFWVLFLLAAVPISIFAIRWTLKKAQALKKLNITKQMLQEAAQKESAGEFVSAGLIHERLKDLEKAAGLFEKGSDFIRAAAVYESLGLMTKVKGMYEKAGDHAKAAETCMMAGDYAEAARIYNQLGDKLKAGHALEMTGNRLAAVRAYREAKDYARASKLLKEEGMIKEAAEMYSFSFAGEELAEANIEKYYSYALLLEKAGETDKSSAVFQSIQSFMPGYRDVQSKLESFGIRSRAEETEAKYDEPKEETPAIKATSLRNLMRSGRMEPRYSLRLWVQVLKALTNKQKQMIFLGNLSPESISIDTGNNVIFDEKASKVFSYVSPEVIAGAKPDEISVIYSMGVILYEMLAGGLDTLGTKKPSESLQDIPSWLEDIAMKCIKKDRGLRYQEITEIFSELKALKDSP